jgi:hypothetical protein
VGTVFNGVHLFKGTGLALEDVDPQVMDGDYKSSKEAFVSGTTGSNVLHINLISAVALVCITAVSVLTLTSD